jgi:hypothetical protein
VSKRELPPGVSLDKDCWLTLGEFEIQTQSVQSIDDEITATQSFWQKLETECVKDCCGIEAFSFWPGDVQRAACGNVELIAKLAELRAIVDQSANVVFNSNGLNQYMPREFLLKLLDHILYHLQGSDCLQRPV